eukprot:250262_1
MTSYAKMEGDQPVQVVTQGPQQVLNVPPQVAYQEPDNGTAYWLACVFCNACGLTAIALTLHCVAQSWWEQRNFSGSNNMWEKARKLRNYGILISCLAFIVLTIWYAVFITKMVAAVNDMNNDNDT